ncbi:hypothetical protein QR680_006283 [Steinernema hermaphroditum]|uniref:SKP1 component POZ domain-containing protein n=2 Tax=Steinernema hermaphroditum TaxID=289476 RepID=A0AA39HWD8_9BILA|nr:hypothetical protein QR680_006283 [Steinernema hermaphroditum]
MEMLKESLAVINFCGEHEQWNVCGDVEPTCDDPFPVYVDGCGQSACQCVIGYVRKGRECVKLADCSKPSCTRHCEPGKKCTLQWHLWGWSQHCISRRRRGIRPFKGYFGSSKPTMASETVKLASSDGKEFEVQKKDFQKANLLKTMMADLGFDEDALPEEAIPMPSVNADALETIVDWLRMHEEEEPRSEEDRQIHRFNRNVSKEDTELLDKQFPRSRLAAVINASYYLEMPDLIDTLVKYTANNLEGKTAEEMSQWLEIPLKKDERN